MVLVAIGIALIIWAFARTSKYRTAKNWDRVEGIIVEARVEQVKVPAVYVYLDYLIPQVRYRYFVGDSGINGEAVSFERRNVMVEAGSSDRYWSEWVAGRTVDVFVNPEEPTDAVLIPDLRPQRKSHYYALVLAGILLSAMGVLLTEFA